MVADLLLGGVAEAVIGYLVAEGSPSIKERLGLARDPIKVAFDTCLHRAVISTFSQPADHKVSFFNAAFLKAAAPLLARTLTPDDNLTAGDLAAVWVEQQGELPHYQRSRYKEEITPLCNTFLLQLRFEIHQYPALLAVAQTQNTIAIRNEVEQLNTILPVLIQAQRDISKTLDAILQEILSLPSRLTQLRKDLVEGMNLLPTDYGSRVNNFLWEYLGDGTSHIVPFGGRDADFAMLNEWLQDSIAPACLFLSAEAGRGKSALLVRWCAFLHEYSDVKVVFVPISIRFETSTKEVFYTALAARLAPIYGEEVNFQTLSADQWKGVCDNYLQKVPPNGQKLVIVLDGLDEATGWQVGPSFIPLPVAQNIRVVASARVQAEREADGWLEALGWYTRGTAISMSLRPLNRAGVIAVLAGMGNPLDQLATRVDVVGKLIDLTEGDPLLVRLYVDALVGSKANPAFIEPEQLIGMETKGLKGYFKRWWHEQQRQWSLSGQNPLDSQKGVETFFFAVASAFGPLSKTDVLAVAKSNGLTKFRLSDISRTVGRFVIGDGESRGYTFSHPRLGYYFFELLDKDEQQAWNGFYVQHGMQTLQTLRNNPQNLWPSEEIYPHAYTVQHYVSHLERASAKRSVFYDLICQEWAQAWEILRGTYDGFLRDVERVWQQAKDETDPEQRIVMQIKCALCQSSVVGLSSNIPAQLLASATLSGVLTQSQALALLRQNTNQKQKLLTIEVLLNEMSRDSRFVLQLLDDARAIEHSSSRARMLAILAPHLPQPQQFYEEALEVTRTIEDRGSRARMLTILAPHLPQPQLFYKEALDTANNIRDLGYRADALSMLAPYIPDEVLTIARTMEDDIQHFRVAVLSALAPHKPLEVLNITRTLIKVNKGLSEDIYNRVLSAVAPYLPTEVLGILREIRLEQNRAQVLCALAPHLPSEVSKLALQMSDAENRARVFCALLPYLNNSDSYQRLLNLSGNLGYALRGVVLSALAPFRSLEVLEIIRTMEDDGIGLRAGVLRMLAPYVPSEVLELTLTMKDVGIGDRTGVMCALAPYVPAKILEIARDIQDPGALMRVLNALTPHLPAQVLEITRTMKKASQRARVLSALARYLPNPKLVLQEALQVARTMQDDVYRAGVLSTLVAHLPDSKDATYELLKVVKYAIHDDHARMRILLALAPYLPDEVLKVARQIKDDVLQAKVLIALAPYFPSDILEVVSTMKDIGARARVLNVLASHLPVEVLENATKLVKEPSSLSRILITLAPYIPAEVFNVARNMQDDGVRGGILGALAPHIPNQILEATFRIREDRVRARVLIALAPYLPTKVSEETLNILDKSVRAEVLISLAPYSVNPDHVYQDVFTIIHSLKDEVTRVTLLTSLVSYAPAKVLQIAPTIKNIDARARILCSLISYLTDPYPVCYEILEISRRQSNEGARSRLLSVLTPYLPREVFHIARTMQNDGVGSRAKILSELAPHLPLEVLEVALTMQESGVGSRVGVLCAVAPFLPISVLESALSLQDDESRARVLSALAEPLLLHLKNDRNLNEALFRILVKIGTRPRPQFHSDLQALMPVFLALGDKATLSYDVPFRTTLTDIQRKNLLARLGELDLSTHLKRLHFLDSLGIPVEVRNTLHFDTSQDIFMSALLVALEQHNSPSNDSYLVPFLRYLYDVEWAGQETHRAFVAGLLGTVPSSSPRQRLARGILEAVQTVCTWWP